jgi:hypothetical protein
MRPTGFCVAIVFFTSVSPSPKVRSNISVWIGPGETLLTRTPSLANSSAAVLVRPMTTNLLAMSNRRAGKADVPADGGIIDDGTTTGPKYGWDFVLHRQQHATDVDVADLMVVLDRLLGGEQAELALGAGVVERDVQSAVGAPTVFSTSATMSSSRPTSVCTNMELPPMSPFNLYDFSSTKL